jgi:hypothetical protein
MSREPIQKSRLDFALRERFSLDVQSAMKGKSEIDNDTIDRAFGQSWSLGGFSLAELSYLIKYYAPNFGNGEVSESVVPQITTLYEMLVDVNPTLKAIPVKGILGKTHVVIGVGTGLHFNDIRYFVEDLEGHGFNRSPYDKALGDKAIEIYHARMGTELLRNSSHLTRTQEAQLNESNRSVHYILSPETARRIIENRPYEKSKKHAP